MPRHRDAQPPPVNVVIAGSRAIPAGSVGRLIVALLANLPADTTVRLREGKFREPGEFEQMIAMLCELFGITVEWRKVEPDPEAYLTGRKAVFHRDIEMIADADLVVCFTAPTQSYDMESGTTALAQKALDADVPVYHYAVGTQRLVRVGENDPEDKYEELMAVLG